MIVVGDKLPPPSQAKAAVASKAGKLFQQQRFGECARLLFQTSGALGEPWLASIFSEAIYEIPQDPNWKEYKETARKILDGLAGQYPDDVRWPLQRLKIESRLCLLKDDFHLKAPDQPRIPKIATLLHELPNIRRLDRRTGRKNRLIIDLLEAKLLTATWLLKGFSQGYPDDQGDIGVEEREEAYQIASRHYDTRDFLELRKKIILKILEGDSKMNRYYFKRRTYYSRRHLEEELMVIDNALNRSGKDE